MEGCFWKWKSNPYKRFETERHFILIDGKLKKKTLLVELTLSDCNAYGMVTLNPKKAGGVFSKNVFLRGSLKPCFLVTSNIFISHNFLENLIEIPQFVQKIWMYSFSILTIFINFSDIFDISLLQRNWWCQHISDHINIIFTFNLKLL